MEVGAQFYTIRAFCKTTEDLAESLKKVADIGYKTVQLSGVCEYDPQWMKEQLDKNGLRCVLTHIAAPSLLEDTAGVIANHDVLGCKYVGLGGYAPFWKKDDEAVPLPQIVPGFAEEYGPVAEQLYKGGKYFMYHNHHYEFQKTNGQTLMEQFAQAIPAEHMGFTLDTYWVQVGGGDPAAWLEKLSGRVPCIHLKDCGFGPTMLPVGEGNINFNRVFAAAEAAGTKYMLVEQDNCNGEDPFDCLKRSYDYLHSCGF